jgi:hypothetical protein
MFGDHPPAFGDRHPWLDPLAPQDIFNPRPDSELAMAGGLAPDPQAFPFTPAGRAEYYEAVRMTAHQMQMTQMQAQASAQVARREEEDAEHRRAAFLLLSP